MKSRRGFLKALGIGAVGATATPFVSDASISQDDINVESISQGFVRENTISKDFGFGEEEVQKVFEQHESRINAIKFVLPSPLLYVDHLCRRPSPVVKGAECSMGGTTTVEFKKIYNEGRDAMLDLHFKPGKKDAPNWYLGLIDNSGFINLCITDRYDDINQAGNGWNEFVKYKGNRPRFDDCVLEITGPGTIKGLFVVGGDISTATKGNHAVGPIIWSIAFFDGGDINVLKGEKLRVRGQL